jgi:S-DNA-T family DNA segregation ATPase FtsK/SpoIIIE
VRSEPSPSPTLSAARQVRPAAPGNVVAPPAPSAPRVRVPSTTAAITPAAEASGPAPAASPASAATPTVPTAPALTAADDTSPASTNGAPRVLVGACLLVLGGLLVAVAAAIGLKRPDRAFPWS